MIAAASSTECGPMNKVEQGNIRSPSLRCILVPSCFALDSAYDRKRVS